MMTSAQVVKMSVLISRQTVLLTTILTQLIIIYVFHLVVKLYFGCLMI